MRYKIDYLLLSAPSRSDLAKHCFVVFTGKDEGEAKAQYFLWAAQKDKELGGKREFSRISIY